MHALTSPRRFPLDDALDRSPRAMLVAVALLITLGIAATGELPAPPGGAVAPPEPLHAAGSTLGAQTLELSSQDWPMICFSCSAIV